MPFRLSLRWPSRQLIAASSFILLVACAALYMGRRWYRFAVSARKKSAGGGCGGDCCPH